MIPQDVRIKITDKYYGRSGAMILMEGARFGYSLAQQEIEELKAANMTLEYNAAEAERTWPQFKQQIIDEATESKDKEIEMWKDGIRKLFAEIEKYEGHCHFIISQWDEYINIKNNL